MVQITTRIKRISSFPKPCSPFFDRLIENFDKLGNERKKIFKLLDDLALRSPALCFDLYLEAAFMLLNNTEKSFIEIHEEKVLLWLLEQFVTLKEKNSRKIKYQLKTFKHILPFPFQAKEVLSVFIVLYELHFDIEMIKKRILTQHRSLDFVEGSFFYTINKRDQFATVHFELQKKEGTFNNEEISFLHQSISELFLKLAENPQFPLIVPSNRELIMKNLRWIMRELDENDLPHIFIDFSKQTINAFQFSAFVCRIKNSIELSLPMKLKHPDIHIECPISYEEKGFLKEGVILSIDIPFNPFLSLIEARQKVALLLQSLIGPLRDFNGGLLEKINENFEHFYREVVAPQESLQSFFYAVVPQERQATAPISLLKISYLSLEQQKKEDTEIDYAIKEDEQAICITMKMPHKDFEKEFRRFLHYHFSQCLFTSAYTQKTTIVSCALLKKNLAITKKLKALSFSFYKKWLEKKELKQVLRLACTTYFVSFDPRIGVDEESSYLHKMLFEGLMRVGANGSLEKGIAEKIEISNAGRHYRFFLKKSFWSNGIPLTAHDFVYSWKMSLKPGFSSPLSYLFYAIENAQAVKEGALALDSLGIKTVDDLILDVSLHYPVPYFLELCAHSCFSPICQVIDLQNPS